MSEWKTIESAPKDGTLVLTYRDGDISDACWSNADQIWCNPRRGWHFPAWNAPTHWMTLPEPPK